MRELLAVIKELALHIRVRLEDAGARGSPVDWAAVEALITLQKAAEEAELHGRAVPAQILQAASDVLLETPPFPEQGSFVAALRSALEPRVVERR